MNENKQKLLQRALHILCGLVVIGVLVILISKGVSFLNGEILDFSDWEDNSDEIIYENSDFILPLMLSPEQAKEDDGELTVLCLGNHPFSDERDSETNVCNMVADLTGATIYNCAFPSSTISSHEPVYDAKAYAWDAFSFYWIASALCQDNMAVYDQLAEVIPELHSEVLPPLEQLKSLDMEKVDILAIMYDGTDYLNVRRVNDDDNPMSNTTYLGAFHSAIDMFQEAYPHIRIIVMSPTYCFGLDSEGKMVSSDMQSYANEFLSTFSIKLSEAAYQQSVSFVDNLYGTIHEDIAPNYLIDHIHLNEDGRKLVAERLADAINQYPTPVIQ